MRDMPAQSKNQRIAIAIAEHSPEKLYSRNKGLLSMSKENQHDFASTKESGLPTKVGTKVKQRMPGIKKLSPTSVVVGRKRIRGKRSAYKR